MAVHLGVVDVEFEEVIAILGRDFAEIGDACSGGTVDRDEEFRLVVVGQVLFGTDAVVAGVGLLIGDEPWVVVGLPRESGQATRLEGLHDSANGQVDGVHDDVLAHHAFHVERHGCHVRYSGADSR